MAIIDDWMSVADQPPDMGRTVMIGSATHNWVGIGCRVLVGEYLHWEDVDGEEMHEPTHWMPLPAPPTE